MKLLNYKGKTPSGETIFGIPNFNTYENYNKGVIDSLMVSFGVVKEIEVGTAFVCTGMVDVNGDKIYEGDIVHTERDGIEWTVEYDPSYGGFIAFNGLNSNRRIEESYGECVVVNDITTPIAEVEIGNGRSFLCNLSQKS